MALIQPTQQRTRIGRRTTSSRNATFLIEAIILLVFLVSCLAVIVQLLVASRTLSQDSSQMLSAVTLASNAAEMFEADPEANASLTLTNSHSMTATCSTTSQKTSAGTMWYADVVVTDASGNTIYSVQTASYQSEVN